MAFLFQTADVCGIWTMLGKESLEDFYRPNPQGSQEGSIVLLSDRTMRRWLSKSAVGSTSLGTMVH
jgi:hypothetical protein